MSLVDLYPEEFKRIARQAPAVSEMAKHFDDPREMSRALGFDSSTVQHWIKGRNNVSASSDRSARAWLLESAQSAKSDTPEAEMLLVIVPSGKSEKVAKVLALLGCDVTEV